MVKRRNIRALVILNPIGFFYDKGHPRGAIYESLEEFQRFANKKLKTGPVQLKSHTCQSQRPKRKPPSAKEWVTSSRTPLLSLPSVRIGLPFPSLFRPM